MGLHTPRTPLTPAAVISVLASVGVYMKDIADLASPRWLKPDPSWYFFSSSSFREVHPGSEMAGQNL